MMWYGFLILVQCVFFKWNWDSALWYLELKLPYEGNFVDQTGPGNKPRGCELRKRQICSFVENTSVSLESLQP